MVQKYLLWKFLTVFSIIAVTAHGMLPLPLPLVSPEGLLVNDSIKLDSEGRMISPLLTALQHIPLATLPALTSASLLGTLANQQRQDMAQQSVQNASEEKKQSEGETVYFLNQTAFFHLIYNLIVQYEV